MRVVVCVPRELTQEQETLVRSLRDVEDTAPDSIDRGAEAGGFWNRVRQAFSA